MEVERTAFVDFVEHEKVCEISERHVCLNGALSNLYIVFILTVLSGAFST